MFFSNNFYEILKIFHHFYSFFTNTQPGSKPKFVRAQKLILGGNETSICFKDFECNKTSNLNAKNHSNQNIHVQQHRSSRGRAFPKTLRFGMATSGEPSTWLPLGKLEGQEPLRFYFPEILKFTKMYHFSTFWKSLDSIEL